MCEAKPGRRCENSSGRALQRAHATLADAMTAPTGPDPHTVAKSITAVEDAQCDYDSTPKGKAELDAKIADAKDAQTRQALLLRADRAVVMVDNRAHQVTLMPPKDPADSAGRARGRQQLGAARERLAYALTAAYKHGTTPTTGGQDRASLDRVDQAEAAVTQLSAEWRFPMRDRNPNASYPTHCPNCGQFTSGGEAHPGCRGAGTFEDALQDRTQAISGSTDERMAATARFINPDLWRRAATSQNPDELVAAVAAADHMAAHGHLQCPTCGQWRSVRFDDHQCPTDRAEHLPQLDGYVFQESDGYWQSMQRRKDDPDHADPGEPVLADGGRVLGSVREADGVEIDEGVMHHWQAVRRDGTVLPFTYIDRADAEQAVADDDYESELEAAAAQVKARQLADRRAPVPTGDHVRIAERAFNQLPLAVRGPWDMRGNNLETTTDANGNPGLLIRNAKYQRHRCVVTIVLNQRDLYDVKVHNMSIRAKDPLYKQADDIDVATMIRLFQDWEAGRA